MTLQTEHEFARLDDLELMERSARGDTLAFETLIHRHNQRLYRAARSILHNADEAEDAVQDAWWKVWTHRGEFRQEAQPSTWLIRIALNEALMRRRRIQARRARISPADAVASLQASQGPRDDDPAAPPGSRPEQLAWRAELRELIETGVSSLPDIYRTVFMLRGIDGMSSAEVAGVLGLQEATVRVRYMRARRMLQQILPPELDPAASQAFDYPHERGIKLAGRLRARLQPPPGAQEADASTG